MDEPGTASIRDRRQLIDRLNRVICGLAVLAGSVAILAGNPTGGCILVGVGVAVFVNLVAGWLGASQSVSGNLLAGIAWATVVGLAVPTGLGVDAPAVILLPAVPAIAIFVSGSRSAVAWVAICMATAFVLYGLTVEDLLPDRVMVAEVRRRMQVVSILGSVLVVGATVLAYEAS